MGACQPMSFQTQMEVAAGLIIVLLFITAGILHDAVMALNRMEGRLEDSRDVLSAHTKLLEAHNLNLIDISRDIARQSSGYVPPTIRFCDRCRKEYPESNRWWTAFRHLPFSFRLCAYPQRKEAPENKWLHGEECIVPEMLEHMANAERTLRAASYKQKREYTEYSESGRHSYVRSLDVSHCGHCGKEYTESDFWWTVSAKEMELEICAGFCHSSYHARDYYFCCERCVMEAVEIFIATQTDPLLLLNSGKTIKDGWNEYLVAAWRSNLRAAHAAAQAAPTAQGVPGVAAAQEIKSGKEPAHRSIPRSLGRGVGQILRDLFRR